MAEASDVEAEDISDEATLEVDWEALLEAELALAATDEVPEEPPPTIPPTPE